MSRKKLIQIGVALALVLAFAVRSLYIRHPILTGGTMGTGYSVTIRGYLLRSEVDRLGREIEAELGQINAQMSTWDPASSISRFNQLEGSGPFPVEGEFAFVVERSLELGKVTHGAFDPTLNPLLNLWGFGSEADEQRVPADSEIASVLKCTGIDKVRVEGPSELWKAVSQVQLDLGAIAKGYGVDSLAGILEMAGYENWFVEIGGEVAVRGKNPADVPWKIGIQYPTTNPMDNSLQGILHMTGGSVATSGDYRNYIEVDGRIYSHILDPRTGRAVQTNTASVTVVAESCMDADGIATALFVMGVEEGLVWVEQQPGVEAMFLVRDENGEISEKFSSGFTATTGYISEQEPENKG